MITPIYSLVIGFGGLVCLLFGLRMSWAWIGFAVFQLAWRLGDLLLYRSSDWVRTLGALAIGLVASIFVLLVVWRLPRLTVIVGGFVAGASITLTLLGTIYVDVATWVLIVLPLVAALAGAAICWRRLSFRTAVIVLSAITGAHLLSNLVRDLLDAAVIAGLSASLRPQLFAPMFATTDALQTAIFLVLTGVGIHYQAHRQPHWQPALGLAGVLFSATILISCARQPVPLDKPLALVNPGADVTPEDRPQINLRPDDRILVLVPHPDDEVLAAAGVIQRALSMGLPVEVVYFTNGDYNQGSFALYFRRISLSPAEALRGGYVRYAEALAAMTTLGVSSDHIRFLGYPDFGTRDIWLNHWADRPPYRARLTRRNAVPYHRTQSYGAAYRGESILADLETILRDTRPTIIFTSHPGDKHPDHQVLPLYLRVAMWDLAAEIGQPQVYYFITHYGRWPQPKGLDPAWPNNPPEEFDVGNRWHSFALTSTEVERKLTALKQHDSQWGSDQPFLESFVRRNESFDTLPDIRLDPQHRQAIIAYESSALPDQPLAGLEPQDQAAFVDADLRTISLEDDKLVLSLIFSTPLSRNVKAQVHLAGYRADRPFAQMPKITIDTTSLGAKVYERGRRLASNRVETRGDALTRQISVPLAMLGDPDRVLLTAWITNDDVPLDSVPWIVIDLSANP
ncbi:MAG: PIG-L family deacetylase [Caldilineales bacterium]|nr:PIG-L family deacetylase [Caldilineales bacterium]